MLFTIGGCREPLWVVERGRVATLRLDSSTESREGFAAVQRGLDLRPPLVLALCLSRETQELTAQAHDELSEVARAAAAQALEALRHLERVADSAPQRPRHRGAEDGHREVEV